MSLIKSISGIRGTIGGKAGEGLNPLDIVKFTSAYATLIRRTTQNTSNKIVVGRDARISGEMVKNVVCGTLMGMGFDVVNIGLASTPTTELAVTMEGACGGIIINKDYDEKQLYVNDSNYLNKEDPLEIDIPNLTRKEALYLNQILNIEEKEKEIVKGKIIKETDIEKYKKFYKYMPNYYDVRL